MWTFLKDIVHLQPLREKLIVKSSHKHFLSKKHCVRVVSGKIYKFLPWKRFYAEYLLLWHLTKKLLVKVIASTDNHWAKGKNVWFTVGFKREVQWLSRLI